MVPYLHKYKSIHENMMFFYTSYRLFPCLRVFSLAPTFMAGENCENIKQHPAPVQSVQAMGNLGGIDIGIDGKTAVAVSKPCLDRSSKGEQTEPRASMLWAHFTLYLFSPLR